MEGCPSGQREQAVNLPASAYVGSNPSPSTAAFGAKDFRPSSPRVTDAIGAEKYSKIAGVAQLVERQPSKLNVAGSNPVSRSPEGRKVTDRKVRQFGVAHIAQAVERVLGKDEVTSSNLVVGSRAQIFWGGVTRLPSLKSVTPFLHTEPGVQ